MWRSFVVILLAWRATSVQSDGSCPTGLRCPKSKAFSHSFVTDCATTLNLTITHLDLLTVTYSCYNNTSTLEAVENKTVFYYHEGDKMYTEKLSLPVSENVYCVFTGCGYDDSDDCFFMMEDFYTCSWPATSSAASSLHHITSTTSVLVSTSATLLCTSLSLRAATSSSTSDPTSSTTMALVVVLVVVFVVITVVMMMFICLMLMIGRHSKSKGQVSFATTAVPFSTGASGMYAMRMILEDEISLAPSVTTVYETRDFHVSANTADITEDKNDLLDHERDSVPLESNMTSENLPFYDNGNDHDSKRKNDSLITIHSHTTRQGQAGNGVETGLTSSHQKHTILGTSEPVHSSNSRFLSQDDGYLSNTILSSSNDGYIGSNISRYGESRASLSPSASEYLPALQTVVSHTHRTMSLSELHVTCDTELQGEPEAIGKEQTLNPTHAVGYIHHNLATTMSQGDVNSGYKQASLFLSPKAPACFQPDSVAGKRVSLDEVKAKWEKTTCTREVIPNTSNGCTGHKRASLLSSEQRKDSCAPINSSWWYLKYDQCIADSRGEDLDVTSSFLCEQSRDNQASLHVDLRDCLKDNSCTLSPSRTSHGSKEGLNTVHFLVDTVDGMRRGNLQTSLDSVSSCEFECAWHTDLVCSRRDDYGCLPAIQHSLQDADGYIDVVVQPGKHGEKCNLSGLKLLPGTEMRTAELNSCHRGNASEQGPFLTAERGNGSTVKCVDDYIYT